MVLTNCLLCGLQLGLDEMFDPVKANFSDVTDKTDLFVSEAIQKTYIDVNEEGAEAAAATGKLSLDVINSAKR